MEKNSEGMAWVGNIYQKFEAMCKNVDDVVSEETMRYVEDQLHTVGSNVKQFCTEVIHELFTSSPTVSSEHLNLNQVQNVGAPAYEDLNVIADEDHSRAELVHSSSVKLVPDHFGLSSEKITKNKNSSVRSTELEPYGVVILSQAQNAGIAACKDLNKSADEDHSWTELVHSSPVSPVEDKNSLVHSTELTPYGVVSLSRAQMDLNKSADEDHSRTELFHSSSVNQSLVQSSELTPYGVVILSRALENELEDYDSTTYDTSIQEAIDISVSKMDMDLSSIDDIKLEESCVIVNGSQHHSLSNEVQKRRSYKKKLRDVFSFKSRIEKGDAEQSALSGETTKRESQGVMFCESDWEII